MAKEPLARARLLEASIKVLTEAEQRLRRLEYYSEGPERALIRTIRDQLLRTQACLLEEASLGKISAALNPM